MASASAIVRTMCPMNCHPTLCGMLAEVRDGKLVGVKGDEANPDSQGFLCVRGQASREIIDNPARLLHPLIRDRRTDDFRRATWDEAFDRIVAGMAIAAGAVGHLARPRRLHDQLRHAHQRAAACPLRELPRQPVLEPGDDLLGPRRFRTRAHRHARDQHQGGHGRALRAHRALGGQSREPAEYRAAPAGGEAPRRAHRHDRRAQDRGRRQVGRRADHPAGHRHRAGAGDDARDLRRAAPRRGVRRERTRSASIGSPRICRPITPAWAAEITGIAGRAHRGTGAALCRHAPGDDRARRKLDAQRRQRLAGRARDRLPAGADRQRRHSRAAASARATAAPRMGAVWAASSEPGRRAPGTAMPNQMSAVTAALARRTHPRPCC